MTKYNWLEQICHDCGAKVGELHDLGCDMERCPVCGCQLISCDAGRRYRELKENIGREPTLEELKNCDMEDHFKLVEDGKVARIPYIQRIVVCNVCGDFDPDFFNVPDEEWDKYIIPPLQGKVLCITCYDKMIELFPKGWKNK